MKWFKLFAPCIIVKGKAQSLIYDVDRSAFYELANELAEILEMAGKMDVAALKVAYGSAIDDFLDQFVQQELAFYTDDPDAFPAIDASWEMPAHITNAIIEVDASPIFDVADVISQLNVLLCKGVQVRCLGCLDKGFLERLVIGAFEGTRINFIELLVPAEMGVDDNYLQELIKKQPRLQKVRVYGADEDRVVRYEDNKLDRVITYHKKDIRNDPREVIAVHRMRINMQLYSEAQGCNTGLNRKVCINRMGEIKNYLSHSGSYGNVISVPLSEIVFGEAFREKWFISNDKIEVCKDCQYRYACVDNSDIIKRDDKYFKVDRCSFDPATNEWGVL